eukprot:GHVR01052875.1.p1 GENE.GHVR01052875.1~~GHVR01052875.1.p1  ORF type:complete len:106 (-),score=7.10 GHVR01052875.1:50-367(-)
MPSMLKAAPLHECAASTRAAILRKYEVIVKFLFRGAAHRRFRYYEPDPIEFSGLPTKELGPEQLWSKWGRLPHRPTRPPSRAVGTGNTDGCRFGNRYRQGSDEPS